jgi:hypothetical protein
VRFGSGRIEAKGYVDVDQVKASVPSSSSWGALSFLSGLVPIELAGKLVNQDGFGTVELDSAYVASIPRARQRGRADGRLLDEERETSGRVRPPAPVPPSVFRDARAHRAGQGHHRVLTPARPDLVG